MTEGMSNKVVKETESRSLNREREGRGRWKKRGEVMIGSKVVEGR